MIGYFNLVNNLNYYVNYYFIIIIVPEKPLWGGSIKYVCMYVCSVVSGRRDSEFRSERTRSRFDRTAQMTCFYSYIILIKKRLLRAAEKDCCYECTWFKAVGFSANRKNRRSHLRILYHVKSGLPCSGSLRLKDGHTISEVNYEQSL